MSAAPRTWLPLPRDEALERALERRLRVSPLCAALLVHRGVRTPEHGLAFLRPGFEDLAEPKTLRDLDAAVERILRALRARERVLLFADYDADGITGAALLHGLFRELSHEVDVLLGDRFRTGYGLTGAAAAEVLRRAPALVITVDCGIASHAGIARLAEAGVDVVVTDHHEPGPTLPPAFAVVDPKRADCESPFKGLSGAGLAFKLAWALAEARGAARRGGALGPCLREAVGLAALGTIADVAPLTGENRVLVTHGLAALRASEAPGVRALFPADAPVDVARVAFDVAPRLNAAGRLGDARRALDVLLAPDADGARAAVRVLDRENRRRQALEETLHEAVRAEAARDAGAPALVLMGADWHAGLIGIVASRVVEEHGRACLLVSAAAEPARGSGRSVAGLPLHEALAAASAHLLAHGGHALAAGFSLRAADFPAFRAAFLREAERRFPAGPPAPELRIDAEVPLAALGAALAGELERLEPHGAGNPAPVLAATGVRVAGEPERVGRAGEHLAFHLNQGATTLRAIWFDGARQRARLARAGAVAFTPRLRRFGGDATVELEVRDLR
jgi:single-stranded-DNA-specific exonuclease